VRWVVVGGGSAGCVVAGRLAEAGHAVTLVEAGATPPPVAASFLDTLATPGATFPGPFTRGRGLGGSGAVNGMVATPGDLDQYASWGWVDAAAALARIQVPLEPASSLGVVDEALLAAAPDASVAVLTTLDGRRVTSADVYLRGVTVLAGDEVVGIELAGDRATGIRLDDGRTLAADAIALAAGVVGTPLLLAAAGCDHRQLGRGLRNHPGLPVTLRLRPGVAVDPHGPVTGALLQRGDLQVTAMNHLGPAAPGHAMLLVVALTTSSVGSVGPGPVVGHELDAADLGRLDDGRVLVEELLAAPSFAGLVDTVTFDPPGGVHHATSTCRMGVVVDDDGLVDGFANVHVVDASAFPDIPRANTYLPTLLLAEHLAARLAPR
jgi:choline dehydrogenase-like flavoprotein